MQIKIILNYRNYVESGIFLNILRKCYPIDNYPGATHIAQAAHLSHFIFYDGFIERLLENPRRYALATSLGIEKLSKFIESIQA